MVKLLLNNLLIEFKTVSAVQFSFLAMLLHPEVQAKVQAEVDSVVGHKRLPEFADLPMMRPWIKTTIVYKTPAPIPVTK